jgi:hypothetical protein
MAAAGFAEPRARGGSFIGRLRGLSVGAQGTARVEDVPRPDSDASLSLA